MLGLKEQVEILKRAEVIRTFNEKEFEDLMNVVHWVVNTARREETVDTVPFEVFTSAFRTVKAVERKSKEVSNGAQSEG